MRCHHTTLPWTPGEASHAHQLQRGQVVGTADWGAGGAEAFRKSPPLQFCAAQGHSHLLRWRIGSWPAQWADGWHSGSGTDSCLYVQGSQQSLLFH